MRQQHLPGMLPIVIAALLLAACVEPTVELDTLSAALPSMTPEQPTALIPTKPPALTATPTSSPSQTPAPAATLSAQIYPSPLPFATPVAGLSASGCPALENVEPANQLPSDEALAIIRQLRSGISDSARLVSDPTFWSSLGPEAVPSELVQSDWMEVHPATETPYKSLISIACGQRTLELSWWVQVCVGVCPTSSPALTSHYYLIKRQGHWLIWARYP